MSPWTYHPPLPHIYTISRIRLCTLANAPEHLSNMVNFKSGIFVKSKSGKNLLSHIPPQSNLQGLGHKGHLTFTLRVTWPIAGASALSSSLYHSRFVSFLCKLETPTKSSSPPNNHISQNSHLFTEDFHHRKQDPHRILLDNPVLSHVDIIPKTRLLYQ